LEKLFCVLLRLCRGTPGHGEWVVACLEGSWAKLVGERLASKCRPLRFENSELVVQVLDSDWKEAVTSIRPELMERLRAATAGEVRTVAVVRRQSPVAGGQ